MFGGKTKAAWMTRRQLEVLETIRKHGRRGVLLWYTEINLSSIRSLAKRGMVDTRSKGRIICTRLGKRRLSQPWPTLQPTGDQKDRADASGSGVEEIDSAGSEAVLPQARQPHVTGL
jgi:hypothetical protein